MTLFEGSFSGQELRLAIVVSRFNDFITRRLLEGAEDVLYRHGVSRDHVDVAWVPGSFEIPMAAGKLAGSGRYDAVICLGCLIRGATSHFDYIAGTATGNIAAAALETGVTVLFGVLTTDTIEQAIERAGTKAGNKGGEAAMAALEMANLYRALKEAGIE